MNITWETAFHQDDWWLHSQDRRGGYFDEAEFLRRYDRFQRYVLTIVNIPDLTLDLLFRFLQNGRRLSKSARA